MTNQLPDPLSVASSCSALAAHVGEAGLQTPSQQGGRWTLDEPIDENGVWTRNPASEKLFTLDSYLNDPEVRRASWIARRDNAAWHAEPNLAHHALAELERAEFPMRIITQNIDGLHQRRDRTRPGS